MKYKISKELFEAVMNIESKGNTFGVESKGMYYAKNYYTYNDFFFMCKEWIEDIVWEDVIIYENQVMFIDNLYAEGGIYIHKCFEHKSIKQALFDACQWLVDTRVEYEG